MSVTFTTYSTKLIEDGCVLLWDQPQCDKEIAIKFHCRAEHELTLSYASLKTVASQIKKGERSFCSKCDKIAGIKREKKTKSQEMPRKFGNICKKLIARSMIIVGTKKESDSAEDGKGRITYDCQRKTHRNSMTYESFGNRSSIVLNAEKKGILYETFCAQCDRFDEVARILQNQGHKHQLLEYENVTSLTYQCGNCDAINTSTVQDMKKNQGHCCHCQHEKQRIPNKEVVQIIESRDMKLTGEYTSNKNVPLECACGELFTTSLHRLVNGSNCVKCAPEKRLQTATERYGEHPFACEAIQEKTKATNMANRGVPYIMQDPEILQRAIETKGKEYIFPSGKTEKVLGFEPAALTFLLQTYQEDDIAVGRDIPQIPFEVKDKKCMYTPDAYIRSENCIIEVKCPYTLTRDLDINFAKFKATIQAGYKCRVLIFNSEKDVEPRSDKYLE